LCAGNAELSTVQLSVKPGLSGSATVVSRSSTALGFAAATAAIARGFVNGMTLGGGVLGFAVDGDRRSWCVPIASVGTASTIVFSEISCGFRTLGMTPSFLICCMSERKRVQDSRHRVALVICAIDALRSIAAW
jgi:hypothetical protein